MSVMSAQNLGNYFDQNPGAVRGNINPQYPSTFHGGGQQYPGFGYGMGGYGFPFMGGFGFPFMGGGKMGGGSPFGGGYGFGGGFGAPGGKAAWNQQQRQSPQQQPQGGQWTTDWQGNRVFSNVQF